MTEMIAAARWYETVRFGDGVTLIHEPWIKPFYRCNIWHVRGCDRDLLFDSGLGHFSLKRHVPLVAEKKLVCVASHTHFDHIGCHHEFPDRCVHRAEAAILADPRNEWTLADRYATEEMFIAPPEGWDTQRYRIEAAPAGRVLEAGNIIDLGDRTFEVIHTPGHSPGGIALYEKKTGILLSGDIVYDGPLIDDAYHSDVGDYLATLEKMRGLEVSVVHGGHFPSFGPTRYHQLIDEYLALKHKPGCHL
jgi:glyoxylase-like metal-dependent hydrolase (beta-lactamase superfamily II)